MGVPLLVVKYFLLPVKLFGLWKEKFLNNIPKLPKYTHVPKLHFQTKSKSTLFFIITMVFSDKCLILAKINCKP